MDDRGRMSHARALGEFPELAREFAAMGLELQRGLPPTEARRHYYGDQRVDEDQLFLTVGAEASTRVLMQGSDLEPFVAVMSFLKALQRSGTRVTQPGCDDLGLRFERVGTVGPWGGKAT